MISITQGLDAAQEGFEACTRGEPAIGYSELYCEAFRRNLEVVRELERFAADEFGCSVSRLAIAWALANQAVDVAIVGSRRAAHIEDSARAVELELTLDHLDRIDAIAAAAAPAEGPYPEMAR